MINRIKAVELFGSNKSKFFFIFFGSVSLLISYFDQDFNYKWISLICYLLCLISGLILTLPKLINFNFPKKFFTRQFLIALSIVFIFALVSRLIYLKDFPFVALGDQVRDGGLNALQIINNQQKNIFSYGRYSAHGLIIPQVTGIFYYLFGTSDLIYRFPASIVGIADILLIFFLVTFCLNLKSGFWSAIALAAMPLHLFY
ncbi:MAG: hypothetical protein KIH89_003955, partial [Candidatus Shapirobacteria bacterium]|nr:hypothetical protein [Candidatus Shapirobacteria bacterium]